MENLIFCSVSTDECLRERQTFYFELTMTHNSSLSVWCPRKGHIYLNKNAAENGLFVQLYMTPYWTSGVKRSNDMFGQKIPNSSTTMCLPELGKKPHYKTSDDIVSQWNSKVI